MKLPLEFLRALTEGKLLKNSRKLAVSLHRANLSRLNNS